MGASERPARPGIRRLKKIKFHPSERTVVIVLQDEHLDRRAVAWAHSGSSIPRKHHGLSHDGNRRVMQGTAVARGSAAGQRS